MRAIAAVPDSQLQGPYCSIVMQYSTILGCTAHAHRQSLARTKVSRNLVALGHALRRHPCHTCTVASRHQVTVSKDRVTLMLCLATATWLIAAVQRCTLATANVTSVQPDSRVLPQSGRPACTAPLRKRHKKQAAPRRMLPPTARRAKRTGKALSEHLNITVRSRCSGSAQQKSVPD